MEPDRQRLVALVRRICAADFASEQELDDAVTEFAAAVRHPRASGLIYYWTDEFDREPAPDEIVDRALSYRPIAL